MDNKKCRKVPQKYRCKLCDYTTCHLSHWKKHIKTRKHKTREMTTNDNKMTTKSAEKCRITFDCICGRSYANRSNLCRHRRSCKKVPKLEKDPSDIEEMRNKLHELESKIFDENQIVTNTDDKSLISTCMQTMMTMMKKMEEKDELFAKQQQQMSELIPRVGNNNNNRININVFLNENCKDAINMSDFLEGIKVQLQDLEYVKNNSLQDGISQIFVNELKQLDTCKRPIHCTDIKRETLYIKDNDDWSKEKPREKLQQGFRDVAHQYRKAIAEWEEKNPNWKNSEKLRDEYVSLVQKTYKDTMGKSENKIIKSIAKETQIDTSTLNND